LKTFKLGGVHPEENKLSAAKATEVLPLPKTAVIPISQHLGAPAKPLVAKGDAVKVGQLIAQGEGFITANIHSSVSGKVKSVDQVIDQSGYKRTAIVIDVEGDE
jgi:Na+-translocating ferredoxin:NAD+ oxidoreductase subunit C